MFVDKIANGLCYSVVNLKVDSIIKFLVSCILYDGPDLKLFILVGWDRSFRLLLGQPGLN